MKKNYGLAEDTPSLDMKFVVALVFNVSFITIGLQIATQYIAYNVDYHQALGNPSFIVLGIPIYGFPQIFAWYKFQGIDDLLEQATNICIMVVIGLNFLLYFLVFHEKKIGNKTLHGSARWANQKEILEMGYIKKPEEPEDGVFIGGYKLKGKVVPLIHTGVEHVLTTAATRSGKGVSLIVNSLLTWQNSTIVLDIKGENWALTAGYRKSLGHKVLKFDPADESGASAKFNPLEELDLFSLTCVQQAQNMAMMIVDPDGKGLEDHWAKSGFGFLAGIVLHVAVMTKAYQNRTATMQDIMLAMSGHTKNAEGEEQNLDELLEEMSLSYTHLEAYIKISDNVDKNVIDEVHKFIASSAKSMLGKAENDRSGVVSTALANMALYGDPIVKLNTSESDFKLADIMNYETPVNLYLVLSPENIDRVKPLVRLLVDMLIRRICKEMTFKDGTSVKGYKHRCLFMFDEFTSLGKLPIIEKSVAYAAGYGLLFYFIIQDFVQLNSAYGKENAIPANCHIKNAFAPNQLETAKILSEMTGKTTIVEKKTSISYSKGGKSRSTNISETARALLTPDECLRLPGMNKVGKEVKPGDMLIFTAGSNPIYGKQYLYFLDENKLNRAKMLVPGLSDKFPVGITDSLYYPRPTDWYQNNVNATLKILENNKNEISKKDMFDNFLEE